MIESEIEKKVNEIDHEMTLEGFMLTEETKKILRDCFLGKKSFEKEIEKIKKECKEVYG